MSTVQPFRIISFPAGHCRWVVVPSEDRDCVEVRLDTGSGHGPLVAEAEWIVTRGEEAPGFLCWRFLEDVTDASFASPTWAPAMLLKAVEETARWLHFQQGSA